MLSRKYYREVARIVSKLPDRKPMSKCAKHILIADLSDMFQRADIDFNPNAFLKACWV